MPKSTPFNFVMKSLVTCVVAVGVLFGGALALTSSSFAADLPLASTSPLVGLTFEDKPLSLPVQRNFQMAMLTAGSEMQRSCGRMEAYGWRMGQSEQGRVDQIFNSTVDRLRGLGYMVESRSSATISNDVTLFTADRSDHHFLFMWSAGEIGLVMVLCESSAPAVSKAVASPAQGLTYPQDVMKSHLPIPAQPKVSAEDVAKFTPVGQWVGNYTCDQGYTGATLQINSLNNENFEGEFRFYPTPHNPYVPSGRYTVYGQYDRDTQRILVNPGKWLVRPKNYYNTILVGSFDPITRTFSAYFQGISGCTSFEAKYLGEMKSATLAVSKKAHKPKKKVVHKITKPQPKPQQTEVTPSAESAVAPMIPNPPPSAAVPVATTPPAVKPVVVPPAPPSVAPQSAVPTLVAPVEASAPPTLKVGNKTIPAGDAIPPAPQEISKDSMVTPPATIPATAAQALPVVGLGAAPPAPATPSPPPAPSSIALPAASNTTLVSPPALGSGRE